MRITQPDRELLHAFVAKYAGDVTGDVLDIGGGAGRYKGLFRGAKSYRILDTDAAQKPDIVGSVEKIPLPDASVDAVLCTQVLGDVWDVHAAAKEIARVLRPGGTLILTESLMNELHDEPFDFWRFTPGAWEKLLGNDFDMIHVESRGGYFSSRAQNRIRRMIEKHDLYKKPLVGRVANLWTTWLTRVAAMRDRQAPLWQHGMRPVAYHR
jgi:ubiquinone/menaquinone biosynthesis C-methylase UbiE